MKIELSAQEIAVIVSMVDSEQFDGAELVINEVRLNDLKKKLQEAK